MVDRKVAVVCFSSMTPPSPVELGVTFCGSGKPGVRFGEGAHDDWIVVTDEAHACVAADP
ncbi:MAG: hypothetical protein JXQ99_07970 [Hyphomicrobiaceae bacterium]